MTPLSKPRITERFNPATEKYEYVCMGHIGDELLKHIVFSDFYERIQKVKRTYENGNKVTMGYS